MTKRSRWRPGYPKRARAWWTSGTRFATRTTAAGWQRVKPGICSWVRACVPSSCRRSIGRCSGLLLLTLELDHRFAFKLVIVAKLDDVALAFVGIAPAA